MTTYSPYAPCPNCTGTDSKEVGFTWWGGIIGPKLLHHVKCQRCGTAYNGRSGKSNTTGIVIYSVVISLACFILMFIVFALGVFR